MSGINVVMGDDRSPHSTYIQCAGHGQRIATNDLRAAMQESTSLQRCFLHFAQAFTVQTAHTAVANGQAKIEERLARWLLMAHDRLAGDELPLTHEFLALMLSVRRPGVTVALQLVESLGLISAKRGLIVVQNRVGLKKDRKRPVRHPGSRVPQANRLERQSLGGGKDDKNRLPASPP